MAKAIIICDFINEIISSEGYAAFAKQNNTLANTARAVEEARKLGFAVIYVKVGFSADYKEHPNNSLLFGKADQFQALRLDTWATSIVDTLKVEDSDFIVTKHRVSPFYASSLEVILRNSPITDLYICGCATDLVVSSTARDAHDRDFNVFVLEDCCAAGSAEDHKAGLSAIRKIATVGSLELFNQLKIK